MYNMGQVEEPSGGAKLEKPSKFSVEFSKDISLSVLLNVCHTTRLLSRLFRFFILAKSFGKSCLPRVKYSACGNKVLYAN